MRAAFDANLILQVALKALVAATTSSHIWSIKSHEFRTQLLERRTSQDLIEYTLLMAFVALASAALFLGAGGSIKGIWSVTNSQLAAANSQAS